MIENKMANDRCWPKPKPITDEEAWDQFEREAKFGPGYDWTRGMSEAELRDFVQQTAWALWRNPSNKTDHDKVSQIMCSLEAEIEAAFEREAE